MFWKFYSQQSRQSHMLYRFKNQVPYVSPADVLQGLLWRKTLVLVNPLCDTNVPNHISRLYISSCLQVVPPKQLFQLAFNPKLMFGFSYYRDGKRLFMNHLQGGCLKLQSEAFICSTEIFNFPTRRIFCCYKLINKNSSSNIQIWQQISRYETIQVFS